LAARGEVLTGLAAIGGRNIVKGAGGVTRDDFSICVEMLARFFDKENGVCGL